MTAFVIVAIAIIALIATRESRVFGAAPEAMPKTTPKITPETRRLTPEESLPLEVFPLRPDTPFGRLIATAARAQNLDACLVAGIVEQESGFDPQARRFEADLGESSLGLMQVLLSTARDLLGSGLTESQLLDPATNLKAGTAFLAFLRRNGIRLPEEVDAYNVGLAGFRKGRRNLDYRHRVTRFTLKRCAQFTV